MEEGIQQAGLSVYGTGNLLVLNEREEILLGRRSERSRYEPGRWNLPGGLRDPEEPLLQTALRETREEFGLQLEASSVVLFRSYRCIYRDRIVEATYHLVRVEGRPSLVMCEREFCEGGFFPLAEATSWDLAFRQEIILQDLLASGRLSSLPPAARWQGL
jgi:8-oxo-dGTP pyrophosphatase MutT (NUDIX family)